MIEPALSSIAEMFGLFGLGWLAQRIGILSRTEVDRIARLIFDVLFPCLIFQVVVGGLDVSRMSELWLLPLLGIAIMAVGYAAGFALRPFVRHPDPGVRRVFHHICAINNFGFLPIFIIQNSMGPEALALFFVFNLGSTVGYWTLGVMTLGEADFSKTLRGLISPPLVALAFSLLLAFAGGQEWVPGFTLRIAEKAGGIAVPLSLIMIGASLAGSIRREFAPDIALLTVARLALIPALNIAWLVLVPLAADVRTICMIVAIMPATATAVILTRIYGGNSEFAAMATLVTTLLSALTIPLGILLLL